MSRWMLLPVVVVVLTGCNGNDNTDSSRTPAPTTAAQPGHESPEAVFAAFQTAAEAGDVPAWLRCVSPQSQATEAASTVVLLSVIAAAHPEKKAEIETLLKKHGLLLKQEDDEEIPVESIQDKVAFVSESTAWMDANGAAEIVGASYRDRRIPGTMGEITVEGESAQAVVTLDDYTKDDIHFVRIGGDWFVQLPVIPGITPGVRIDDSSFADALDAADWNNLFPPPMEAVTMQDFLSSWQLTLDVKAQPAGQLLAQLADELGLGFDAGSVSEATLQKPVTLQVADGSRLGAIEEICRQVELTPVYTPATLRVEPGKRPYPAILAGPFLFDVTAFETRPGTATGQMRIQVFAPHLPANVLRQIDQSFADPVSLAAVSDQNDNNLLRDFETSASFIPATTVFDYSLSVKLKNLLKSVESIHRLTGTLSLSLPTRVEVLKFDEAKAGAEQTAGEVAIKLSEIKDGKFTFVCDGVNWHDIEILGFDREGKRVGAILSGYTGGDSETVSQGYAEPLPVRFEIRAVTKRETLDYEFHFPEIPVPGFDEMPVQLAELKFEGDSPLTVKFDSLGGTPQFPEMTFLAANHSNKDAESTELKVTCLNADGKELDQFLTEYSEVLPGGKEQPIQLTVFDLPQGTKAAKAIVTSVDFTDATTWKAKNE